MQPQDFNHSMESEERFRGLLHAAPDAIIIADRDGVIVFANGECESLFGYTRDDLIGQPIEFLLPAASRSAHSTYVNAYFVGKPLIDPKAGRTVEALRRNGDRFPVAVRLRPYSTPQGEFVTCIVRDVTAQQNATREINELNRALQRHVRELTELNHELETFSYSLSHDLQGPLRAINGFCQILMEEFGTEFTGDAKANLERIHRASERMAGLLDGILQLFQTVRSDLRRDTVDFSALATDVAQSLQESVPGRTIHIDVEPGITVHADKGIVRLIIENLLANALKFTEGQPETRIAVGLTENGGKESFFVRDNGVGFDMQYVHKLFRPFERLHQDFPGTGIGLATVARCIRKHGGAIWAESHVGRGATFYFTLGEEGLISIR